jgi:hypothetical protein
MKQISSRWTRFIKWATPIVWVGGFAYLIVQAAMESTVDRSFLLVLAALALFGVVLMKLYIWNLADEVYDCGDSLLVRRGKVEETVPLAGIERVALALFSRPPRITLQLATPGKFGRRIVFTPPTAPGLELFGRNPIAEDLSARVQRAR